MKRNSRCLLSIVLLGREKVKAITRPPGCVTALRVAEVGVMQATWVRTAGGKQSYTWRSQDKIFRVWTHLGLSVSLDWRPCPHPRCLLQGTWHIGLSETFQAKSHLHSQPQAVMYAEARALKVAFVPCLLGENTELMRVLNQGQAATLWRALQLISCRVLVSRPGPCGKTRR